MIASPLYEERFGPIERRVRRLARGSRWLARGVTGRPRRLLVEIRWRLGDEIMAIPVYEALKRRYPDVYLTVWCRYPELLEGNPFVDAVNTEETAPDRYVCLRSGPREAYRPAHYARCAGVPVPQTRPRLYFPDWAAPALDALPDEGRARVAVAAGASWATKRWPLEAWRTLCGTLAERGCAMVELGAQEDCAAGAGALGAAASLVGRTGVRDAACVLRAARLLICCDSGLMHLALAAGTPVLALFGPTVPAILIRDEPNLHVLTNQRTCQGCWNASGRMTEEGVCPLHIAECMETISVDAVVQRAQEILSGRAPDGAPGP